MPYADAMNKTLVFAIFDFDRFSKHDQIGEVKVPLCQIDLAQTIEEWRELQSVEGEGGQVISQLIRLIINDNFNYLVIIILLIIKIVRSLLLNRINFPKNKYTSTLFLSHPVRTIGCLHRIFLYISFT